MKKLDIIYEDKSLLVVNKPSGILTIATTKEKEKTLYHEVFEYLHRKNQKVFIVNRLDKDTSGLIIFAKNQNIKNLLQSNWETTIRKYYAVVIGKINKPNTIEQYLIEGKDLKTYITTNKQKGKKAITMINPIKQTTAYTLLDVEIKTGRKNQIRVALSDLNHPIIGDKKYNAKKNPIGRLGLHSYYLEFVHPKTKQHIKLETKIPKEFSKIFE